MYIPSGVAGQFPNCIDRSSCVIAHVRRDRLAWNARHAEEPGSVIKTLVMISSYIVLLYTLASNAACDPKFYLPGFGFSFLDISVPAKGKWEDQGGQLSDVELACPCQPCRGGARAPGSDTACRPCALLVKAGSTACVRSRQPGQESPRLLDNCTLSSFYICSLT